jgi:hypothetical protein
LALKSIGLFARGLLSLTACPHAEREEVAVGAVLSRPFVELPSDDVSGHEPDFLDEFDPVLRTPLG